MVGSARKQRQNVSGEENAIMNPSQMNIPLENIQHEPLLPKSQQHQNDIPIEAIVQPHDLFDFK